MRNPVRTERLAACALAVALAPAASAAAQAWMPLGGEGAVTVATQTIENTGHTLENGVTVPEGQSRDASIFFEGEYAFTDRLSVTAGIPLVFAKYLGPRHTPEPPTVQPSDACYCWQEGLADFSFTARWSLLNARTAVTPSVAVGAPSHDYEYRGEAVIGRRLPELRLAVDAGRRLDWISPRLAVQGRYAYAFVKRVLDIPNNRSNLWADVLYQATDRLNLRVGVAGQITHGGLSSGTTPPPETVVPWGEIDTLEKFEQHDRLIRDNHLRVGGGAAYDFSRLTLFLSYLEYATGSNTHAGRAVTAGFSIPFSVRKP